MQHPVVSDPRRFVSLLVNGLLFVALPICIAVPFLVHAYHGAGLSVDFEHYELPAARVVAAGGSPYPSYGYPPLVAFALVPFTWLPGPNIIFTVLLALCVPVSMRLFGVTDWRCYGVVFAWAPVLAGLQTGNVTIPLLLGAAICWHSRDRWKIVAVSGGLTVAAKLLTWPLVVWLAATRRIAAGVGVAVVAAGVSLVLWSVLGFSGLAKYPSQISSIEKVVSPESYTLKVVLEDAGVGSGPARVVWGFSVLVLLAGVVFFGWRGDDRRSFALCSLAMIVGSPIVWLHSFTFLIGAIAVMRPRLGAAWLLPLPLVIAAGTGNGAPWQTAGVLAITVLTVGVALLPERVRPAATVAATPAAITQS